MTRELDRLSRVRTVFDGWRSISISLYMSLVGYGVLVGIPVISTAVRVLAGARVTIRLVLRGNRERANYQQKTVIEYDSPWRPARPC